uniref:MARVEL domain-containing protein n=1 Tax=Strongyloides venezuelensis TaxID=75913 RepID=A0A0K0FF41_STRVS
MDYQVILIGELVFLIAGETGIAMLHGWTEGVIYSFQAYYTPMWLCACLMVLLLLLIISLVIVFICLHFNRPSVIYSHVASLILAWPISIALTSAGIATGTPILVGICFLLYFSTLLIFAYIYATAKWKSTEIEDITP